MNEWSQTKELTFGSVTIKIFRPNQTKEEQEQNERKAREALMVAMAGAPKTRNT